MAYTPEGKYYPSWYNYNSGAGSMPSEQQDPWAMWSGMPGLSTLLGGGYQMGSFDPMSYTAQSLTEYQKMLSGGYDRDLKGLSGFLQPMQEQTKTAATQAGRSATRSLKAAEGAGFDPASAAYFESVFGAMPAQQAPEQSLAAQQMQTQANAPIEAHNLSMRQQGAAGMGSIETANQQAAMNMAMQKNAVMNQALSAGVDALASLMGYSMGTMPQTTFQSSAFGGQTSFQHPFGVNPYSWFYQYNPPY